MPPLSPRPRADERPAPITAQAGHRRHRRQLQHLGAALGIAACLAPATSATATPLAADNQGLLFALGLLTGALLALLASHLYRGAVRAPPTLPKRQQARREAHLRSVFDHAPDAMLVCNAAGRIVMVSRQAETLLGYDRRDLLRRSVQQLVPAGLRDCHAGQQQGFLDGVPTDAMEAGRELATQTKSGELVPVDIRLARVEHRGRTYVIAAIRDLRERHRAEQHQAQLQGKVRERTAALRRSREELQAIVDNSPMLIHVKDQAGRYTLVNHRWCECAGRSEDEALGRSDELLFAPDLAAAMARDDELVLDQGEPSQFEEVRGQDEARRVLATYKFPLRDAEGRPYGLCGISHDITERKQHETEMRRARDQAQEASRAKTAFLANISHEIRTPINSIIGMTHLALAGKLPQQEHDYVARAHQSASELRAIIDDILDFSRIEAGQLTIDAAAFRLEDVLETFTGTIGPMAAAKGLKLLLDYPPDLPTLLVGDPLRLSQALIGLGNNAVKFTEHGEVVLRVRVDEQGSGQVMLRFAISDTGIGLSQAQREGLFEPFRQGDNSFTRRFGGTGLGLAICRRLLEMMDGHLWVESKPDVGSTFHASARFGRQRAAGEVQPAPTADQQGRERPRSLDALRLEDQAGNRDPTAKMLASGAGITGYAGLTPDAATPPRRSMLERFCEDYRGFSGQFAAAAREPRADARLRLAHTLKGVAGNLGLTDIARDAEALERACRNGEPGDTLAALAAPIDAQIQNLAASMVARTAIATAAEPCQELPVISRAHATEVQALAGRLQRLLDDGDAQALDIAERLAAAVCNDSGLGRRLKALSRRIQRFEFTLAAADLRALEDPLGRLGTDAAAPCNAATADTGKLMDRLSLLLEADDTGADAVAAELVGALHDQPRLTEQARLVAHWIDEFDYTAAREALRVLRLQQTREVEVDDGATHRADR